MARLFIDVDQGDYVSLGGELGSYGIHKRLYTLVGNIDDLSADELNRLVPMIHFNRYHQNEDGIPEGTARVLQVSWSEPKASGRGSKPYVRLRSLPFGHVGTAQTSRKRYTAAEVQQYVATHYQIVK